MDDVILSIGMSLRQSERAGNVLRQSNRRDDATAADSRTKKDAARVARAQAGDELVWDEWFDEYYQPLFRYAYLRLRNRTEAEDIVSQTFVEAYRGITRYKHTGKPLLAWLYRIAHNLVYDRIKAQSRQPETEAAHESIPVDANEEPEAGIVSMDLLNAIDELTDEQRDVIVLRYFMAMSSLEVGSMLGKTRPAVFSLQSRALASLREKLDGVLDL